MHILYSDSNSKLAKRRSYLSFRLNAENNSGKIEEKYNIGFGTKLFYAKMDFMCTLSRDVFTVPKVFSVDFDRRVFFLLWILSTNNLYLTLNLLQPIAIHYKFVNNFNTHAVKATLQQPSFKLASWYFNLFII